MKSLGRENPRLKYPIGRNQRSRARRPTGMPNQPLKAMQGDGLLGMRCEKRGQSFDFRGIAHRGGCAMAFNGRHRAWIKSVMRITAFERMQLPSGLGDIGRWASPIA